jgi:hypothetical protein
MTTSPDDGYKPDCERRVSQYLGFDVQVQLHEIGPGTEGSGGHDGLPPPEAVLGTRRLRMMTTGSP